MGEVNAAPVAVVVLAKVEALTEAPAVAAAAAERKASRSRSWLTWKPEYVAGEWQTTRERTSPVEGREQVDEEGGAGMGVVEGCPCRRRRS